MTSRTRVRAGCTLLFIHLLPAVISPVGAAAISSNEALSIQEAAELALSEQPRLGMLDAQARAARASAVAARQLPDPQLKVGIADWPVTSRDAGSFTRDSDTQFQVGVEQEFPRARKRRLRGEVYERESEQLATQRQAAERAIRRDVGMAWLTVWQYEATQTLVAASERQAEAQREVVQVGLETGGATQADYFAASQEVERLKDTVRDAGQQLGRARVLLGRWIGDAAARPIGEEPPALPELPPIADVMTSAAAHPALATVNALVAKAATKVSLAGAAYQPDWRAEIGYGDRPNFSDMVSVRVGIDLPLFTAHRQDQGMLAALSEQEAAEDASEDTKRELLADARAAYEDARHLRERLTAYVHVLLPQSLARVEAATAGWRAGRNQFREVLDARRSVLEMQLAQLGVRAALLKAMQALAYYGAFEPARRGEGGSDE